MDLQPWQERVIEEKNELDKKLESLQGFLTSLLFKHLSKDDQIILEDQELFMRRYSGTLAKRIERFNANDMDLQPWQQRVIDEKNELDNRIINLNWFIESSAFNKIDRDEQRRLRIQLELMFELQAVLLARIKSFQPLGSK